jgi:hypothetical protein
MGASTPRWVATLYHRTLGPSSDTLHHGLRSGRQLNEGLGKGRFCLPTAA